ncbi:Uncharacterised protein [uncultured archaeon]|nr:Uncharacterised protein [uncultured archaeon]
MSFSLPSTKARKSLIFVVRYTVRKVSFSVLASDRLRRSISVTGVMPWGAILFWLESIKYM